MTDQLFGLDTDRDTAARVMNLFVRNDWVAVEPALYRGKWFDYRFMNPVQATYLYAHEYEKAYRRAFSTNIDSQVAIHIQPLKVETLFELPECGDTDASRRRLASKKRKIAGIWRGRMVADAMGVPYGFYLERAFHWALRYWQQSHLPRPQQLYSDMIVERMAADWEERQRDEFFYSTKPQYKNAAYYQAIDAIGAHAALEGTTMFSQNQHHDWMLQQCKERRNGHAILAQMVFHDEVLPIDKVRRDLDEHGFERVLSFAESKPVIERYN